MSTTTTALAEVPLFSELSGRDLKRLASSMIERTFADGQEVVAEGAGGVGFFVILEGRAAVTVHGEARGTLEPGDYFGEMSLLDGGERTATVTAVGELRCAAMTMWSFRPFVKDHPDIAWALLVALVKRSRDVPAA